MKAIKDQRSQPPARVEFASPVAENGILNTLYGHLKMATGSSLQQDEVARQCAEEIAKRQQEINELIGYVKTTNERINTLERENTEADGHRRGAEQNSQQALDMAKGFADLLVSLGAEIPADQVEILRNGNVGRLGRHHDELNGQQP